MPRKTKRPVAKAAVQIETYGHPTRFELVEDKGQDFVHITASDFDTVEGNFLSIQEAKLYRAILDFLVENN